MSWGQVLTFKKTALATNAVISGQGSGEIRKFITEEGLPSDRLVAVKQLEPNYDQWLLGTSIGQ